MQIPCFQQTISAPVQCRGVGLHSGEAVTMRLLPADADTGIRFRRTDVSDSTKSTIRARYDAVCDTRLGTTLANAYGVKIATVEHLMAALWGAGVDNLLIETDGPEVPVMDGSSAPFMALLEQVGLYALPALRKVIVMDDVVTASEGKSSAALMPAPGFMLDIEIDFPHAAIARQRARYDFSETTFAESLSAARTFGFAAEVEQLREMGLARGGSLENAVVIGDDGVLNAEGLRFEDEFVRHKALDCIGDYFLAGMRIIGNVRTRRPGHGINNKLLHTLFSTPSAWHITTADRLASLAAYVTLPGRAAIGNASLIGAVMLPDRN